MKNLKLCLKKRAKTIIIPIAAMMLSLGASIPCEAQMWLPASSIEVQAPDPSGSPAPSSYYLGSDTTTHISNFKLAQGSPFHAYVSGWSGDPGNAGGGFSFGYGDTHPGAYYIPLGAVILPDVVDVQVGCLDLPLIGSLFGDRAIIVAYYDDNLRNYYIKLYSWAWFGPSPPSGSVSLIATYLLPSGMSSTVPYDRISLSVSNDVNKFVVAWGANGRIYTAAGELSSSGSPFSLNISPLLPAPAPDIDISGSGDFHWPDVSISTGYDSVYYAYYDNTNGDELVKTIPYATLFNSTTSTLTPLSVDASAISLTGSTLPVSLATPVSVPDGWAYTYAENDVIKVRLYDPGIPAAKTVNVNDGTFAFDISGSTNINPTIAYYPGDEFMVGWATTATAATYGATYGYVALQLNSDATTLLTAVDYLLVADDPTLEVGNTPLICFSDYVFGTMDIYATFGQIDSGYSLKHKIHDWPSTNTFKKAEATALSLGQTSSPLKIGPNPFSNSLRLFSNNSKEEVAIQFADITGRTIFKTSGSISGINNLLDQQVGLLSNGTYLMKTSNKMGEQQVFKLEKQ